MIWLLFGQYWENWSTFYFIICSHCSIRRRHHENPEFFPLHDDLFVFTFPSLPLSPIKKKTRQKFDATLFQFFPVIIIIISPLYWKVTPGACQANPCEQPISFFSILSQQEIKWLKRSSAWWARKRNFLQFKHYNSIKYKNNFSDISKP